MTLLQIKNPNWHRATMGSKEDKGGKEQVLLWKLRGQNLLPAAGKGREVGKKQVRNTMGKEILNYTHPLPSFFSFPTQTGNFFDIL